MLRSWTRIDEVFSAVVDCEGSERDLALQRLCAGDDALRREVGSLLAAHERASSFIELPAFDGLPRDELRPLSTVSLNQRIGRYTLRRVIGRGGMGTVYEAEQESPRRVVALKILNRGDLTERAVRRFEREADILARLSHPGIARILEAGMPESGADTPPFFAMELVKGEPITEFAAKRELSIPARLELAIEVCEAVMHAHQKGVIHRDLKPSNILVDDTGRPTILDFGIARLKEASEETATCETQAGQLLGTLPFMSPEQVSGRISEIDIRSDVYSLGVVLYVLFAGRHPYDLANLSFLAAARVICDQPPRALSALSRGGDLETVIHKAFCKTPERRYQTVAELLQDLRHVSANEPIRARAPSTTYHLQKLIVRHKLLFVLAGLLVMVIVGAAVATGWMALRFAQQRDIARQSVELESEARTSAEEFAGLLQRLFDHADPSAGVSKEPSLRQVLDSGYERLGEIENTGVRARLMTVMGDVYRKLEHPQRARELLESAVALRRAAGRPPADLAESLLKLSQFHLSVGELDAAEAATRETLEILRAQHGENHERVAEAWEHRGISRHYAGDYAASVDYCRRSLDIRRRLYAGPHPDVATALANVGRSLTLLGHVEEAENCLREALSIRRELGDPTQIEQNLEGLAILVWKCDPGESERLVGEQLAMARIAYRESHPRLAWILHNYGFVVLKNRGPQEAEPILREAVEVCRKSGNQGDLLARSQINLSDCLLRQGKRDEAIESLLETVESLNRTLGADNERTLDAQKRLSDALWYDND